jgi:hypothetical protein
MVALAHQQLPKYPRTLARARAHTHTRAAGLNSLALATRLTPALLWYERPPGTSAATAAGPLSSSGASSMVNQASQMAAATLQVQAGWEGVCKKCICQLRRGEEARP